MRIFLFHLDPTTVNGILLSWLTTNQFDKQDLFFSWMSFWTGVLHARRISSLHIIRATVHASNVAFHALIRSKFDYAAQRWQFWLQAMMMNCVCGIVDRRKTSRLISSRDHFPRSSPSQISETLSCSIWTWAEPTLRLCWMRLCNCYNHCTMVPLVILV